MDRNQYSFRQRILFSSHILNHSGYDNHYILSICLIQKIFLKILPHFGRQGPKVYGQSILLHPA